MKTIRTTACVFGIVLLAAVMSGSGSRVAADAAIDPEVLVAREAAWRAFYDGDVKALGDVLPEEFIGINMNDAPFTNRARLRLIATLHHPAVIRKILAHVGFAPSGPSPGPAPPEPGAAAS